jgi:hypothetical protein
LGDSSIQRLRFTLDEKDILTIDDVKELIGSSGKAFDFKVDKDEVVEISRKE